MKLLIKRFLAFQLDNILITIASVIIYFLLNNKLNDIIMTKYTIIYISIYLSYYFILEYYFNITLGKLILKLKINSDKNKLQSFLKRTLFRLIPFDIISFIFSNSNKFWHDEFSNTYVIEY